MHTTGSATHRTIIPQSERPVQRRNFEAVISPTELVESFTGKRQSHHFVDRNRLGNHICYHSDLPGPQT